MTFAEVEDYSQTLRYSAVTPRLLQVTTLHLRTLRSRIKCCMPLPLLHMVSCTHQLHTCKRIPHYRKFLNVLLAYIVLTSSMAATLTTLRPVARVRMFACIDRAIPVQKKSSRAGAANGLSCTPLCNLAGGKGPENDGGSRSADLQNGEPAVQWPAHCLGESTATGGSHCTSFQMPCPALAVR